MLSWLLSFFDFLLFLLTLRPSIFILIVAAVFSIFPVADGIRDGKIDWKAVRRPWKISLIVLFVLFSPLFILIIFRPLFGSG